MLFLSYLHLLLFFNFVFSFYCIFFFLWTGKNGKNYISAKISGGGGGGGGGGSGSRS